MPVQAAESSKASLLKRIQLQTSTDHGFEAFGSTLHELDPVVPVCQWLTEVGHRQDSFIKPGHGLLERLVGSRIKPDKGPERVRPVALSLCKRVKAAATSALARTHLTLVQPLVLRILGPHDASVETEHSGLEQVSFTGIQERPRSCRNEELRQNQ